MANRAMAIRSIPSRLGPIPVATLTFLVVLLAGLPAAPLAGPIRRSDPVGTGQEPADPVTAGSGWIVADEGDRLEFLAAWERSRTGRYTLSAVLHRRPLSEEESLYGSGAAATGPPAGATITREVHRAQLDADHRLHQVGDLATVVDPVNGKRTCRRIDDRFWCSNETPAAPDDAADDVLAVTQAVADSTATHRLYRLVELDGSGLTSVDGFDRLTTIAHDLDCWDVRALIGDQGHRWGRRSQFCFDVATRAMVMTRTFGPKRVDTLVAYELSADVTPSDLDPR